MYSPRRGYDIWSDSSIDNFDYETELQEEYSDLGYNLREIQPVGKELTND